MTADPESTKRKAATAKAAGQGRQSSSSADRSRSLKTASTWKDALLGHSGWFLTVCLQLLMLPSPPEVLAASTGISKNRRDPALLEEYCKNFTHGNPGAMEFYSPMYPREYPADISCFRTITAEFGYFVRIDFRDSFRIEPPNNEGNCGYDYLEIRDGDQGYSPLIGKYCGDDFPPIITSSGRSLWLRFTSDGTIQYKGFRIVYTFIPNPLGKLPDIGKCEFHATGYQDFIGTSNISEDRIAYSEEYGVPIDCIWSIEVQEKHKIYLQFPEYNLFHPNDCHLNYIQVFDEKMMLNEQYQLSKFCGSIAETISSKSNLVYIRFYAEKTGIKSTFVSLFTSMRILDSNEEESACRPEDEYDCEDASCIHQSLLCNEVRNCKFGWDEESCDASASSIQLDFTSPHVILILLLLIAILLGMGGGITWSMLKTLREDKAELEAELVSPEDEGGGAKAPEAKDGEQQEHHHHQHQHAKAHLQQDQPKPPPPAGSMTPKSKLTSAERGSNHHLRVPLRLVTPPPPPQAPATSSSNYKRPLPPRVNNLQQEVIYNASSTDGAGGLDCYVPDGGFPFLSGGGGGGHNRHHHQKI